MRRMKYVARMGERRSACKVFVGKLEGMGSLGRSRLKWDDSIRRGSWGNKVGNCGLDSSGSG
jgi:hypothetical protein